MDLDAAEQLFADYAWALDTADWALLGSVFAEQGSFSGEIAGGGGFGPFEGREATVEFVSSTVAGQQDRRRHVITNVRVEQGGRTATAYLSLLVVADGAVTVQSCGAYRGELAEEAGAVRFARLHLELDAPF